MYQNVLFCSLSFLFVDDFLAVAVVTRGLLKLPKLKNRRGRIQLRLVIYQTVAFKDVRAKIF